MRYGVASSKTTTATWHLLGLLWGALLPKISSYLHQPLLKNPSVHCWRLYRTAFSNSKITVPKSPRVLKGQWQEGLHNLWQNSEKPLPSPSHWHANITNRTWPNNYLCNPYKDRGATGCTVISEAPSSRSITASQRMQWRHSDIVAANAAQFKR